METSIDKQRKWDRRYLSIAQLVSTWSTCTKSNRHIGCVCTRNNRILTTGYNGAPMGMSSCVERGYCNKYEHGKHGSEGQELCYGVHAEQNAIAQAAFKGESLLGATLYCTHHPCSICAKSIINSGIKRVVYIWDYPDEMAEQLFKEADIEIERMNIE